jgi:hypothetical protein
MKRSGTDTAMAGEVAWFLAEVQRLAFAAVHAVIGQELARRRSQPQPTHARRRRAAQRTKRQLELALAAVPQRQLELPLTQQRGHDLSQDAQLLAETGPAGEGASASGAAGSPRPTTPEQRRTATGIRNRTLWTRESVVGELAAWMLSGTTIDAQFMTRHGPRGLVAAARRIFGRFDAALNVAALHNAKLYPEGPPERMAGRGDRGRLAAASQREPQ